MFNIDFHGKQTRVLQEYEAPSNVKFYPSSFHKARRFSDILTAEQKRIKTLVTFNTKYNMVRLLGG